MHKYKVRTYDVGLIGRLTQADSYHDFDFESPKELSEFAKEIGTNGFPDGDKKWIMPGAIIWIKER